MAVDEGPEALRLQRDNRSYYFCSGDCLRSFADPEEARRRVGRRLLLAWPLSIAVVVLTWRPPFREAALVAGVLAAVVQCYAGSGFYEGAYDAVRRRVGNMDLLIATGTTAAFGYSVAVLALPGRLPGPTYFDASALIVTVILTGTYLEQRTRRHAGSALRALGEMLPSTVTVLDEVGEHRVRRDQVSVGAVVRVSARERFPVDGLVRDGVSSADESLLTGEADPVRKGPGELVIAGSRNLDGPLSVEVRRTGADTFVAHVGGLLQDAELSRVPLQRQADRLAAWFAPFTLTLAAGAALLWFVALHGDVTVGVLVFVTVAVTACPCAFGLATPAALLVGTGRAAEEGILFRGGDSIEQAAEVDTVLADKTGTLTTPEPSVASVAAVAPSTEAEVFRLAAALEVGVDHPLARAVRREASVRGISPLPLERPRLEPGRGVSASAGGHRVELVRGVEPELGPPAGDPLGGWRRAAEERGESWALLLRDGVPIGGVSFRATLAVGAAEAVAELRGEGLRVAMVTGDNERSARAVARRLGIDEVHAGVSPDGKVDLLRRLRSEGRRVAFVGDGVNDAPVLAVANVGIAVGTGAEVAREAGQVLLVRNDLEGVPRALRLARRTVGRVRRNLYWAIGYNAVLLPIAAGALVPALGLSVYRYLPVLGAVAMGLSSTTVLLNSLSLRWDGGLRAGTRAAASSSPG